MPGDPTRVFDVVLTVADGSPMVVRADRLRADLRSQGVSECYHGFSIPIEALGGVDQYARCVWSDLAVDLPGSPWRPRRRRGKSVRRGGLYLHIDSPPSGDPRLQGWIYDTSDPFRRLTIGIYVDERLASLSVASLYRQIGAENSGDDFHGFILPLPAPLSTMASGVTLIDMERGRVLIRVGPRDL